jgi:kinesin family protein 11
LRPLNEREMKHGTLPVVSASTKDKTVTVIKGKGKNQNKSTYKFDNVFTSFSTQEDIFEATLQPIIRDVLNGYESTVFAYGQVRLLSFLRVLYCISFFFCLYQKQRDECL